MIKVIMAAGRIPLGSTVTKRTGTKEYVLKDKLRLFGPDQERQTINAQGGVRLLVCDGDANAISSDTELVWLAHPDSLISVLQQTAYDDWTICPTCGYDTDRVLD